MRSYKNYKTVLFRWPDDKVELSPLILKYWNIRDEISCIDGLLFKSHKLVVPKSLQSQMLDKIHESHLGIVKCTSRAREVLFWIKMARDIEDRVRSCVICTNNQNVNAKEPMLIPDLPDRPWSKLAADLFEFRDNQYLLVVDYFSKWPEVLKLDNQSSKTTIDCMKSLMSRYGYPDTVITDNGPQFSSVEFQTFAKDYEFTHVTSSPRFPQSNGQAERTVQTIKNLIKKSDDPHKALLGYRNTPLDIGLSPAQLFLNRRLRTSLPTAATLLAPFSADAKEIHDKLKLRQIKSKYNFDKHANRELRPLHPGEPVVMLTGNKWSNAKIVEKHRTPRSYIVKTSDGRHFRRNRKHLRPTALREIEKESQMSDISQIPDICKPQLVDQGKPQIVPQKPLLVEKSPEQTKVEKPTITRSGRTVKEPSRYKEFVTE